MTWKVPATPKSAKALKKNMEEQNVGLLTRKLEEIDTLIGRLLREDEDSVVGAIVVLTGARVAPTEVRIEVRKRKEQNH